MVGQPDPERVIQVNIPPIPYKSDHLSLSITSHAGNAHGVIASEGKMWNEQRKFMVQALTKLGMNSKEDSVMVPTIVGETHNLCSILEKRSKEEGAIPVKDIYTPLSCSIVWYMVTGKAIKCVRKDSAFVVVFLLQLCLYGRGSCHIQ